MNRFIVNILLLLAFLSKPVAPATAKNIWQGCANVTEIPSAECKALVALHNSTNGKKWKKIADGCKQTRLAAGMGSVADQET